MKTKEMFCVSNAIDYLEHVITPQQLHIATETIKVVRDLKSTTKTSELRSSLGLCNVYRRLVPDFYRVTAPRKKTQKKRKTDTFRDNKEQRTMDDLKQTLVSLPVFAIPRPKG